MNLNYTCALEFRRKKVTKYLFILLVCVCATFFRLCNIAPSTNTCQRAIIPNTVKNFVLLLRLIFGGLNYIIFHSERNCMKPYKPRQE